MYPGTLNETACKQTGQNCAGADWLRLDPMQLCQQGSWERSSHLGSSDRNASTHRACPASAKTAVTGPTSIVPTQHAWLTHARKRALEHYCSGLCAPYNHGMVAVAAEAAGAGVRGLLPVIGKWH